MQVGKRRVLLGKKELLPSNNLLLFGNKLFWLSHKELLLSNKELLPSNNLLLFGKKELLSSHNILLFGNKRLLPSRKGVGVGQTPLLPSQTAGQASKKGIFSPNDVVKNTALRLATT